MVERSVRSASDRERWVTKIYYLELLRASGGVKLLFPATFAVVSIHSSFKEG
jgi:hypothetical protein